MLGFNVRTLIYIDLHGNPEESVHFTQLSHSHLSDSDPINVWMKTNHCFGLKMQCAEMITIRLFSTMFQARGRSISTGPSDICGTSVGIETTDEWLESDSGYVSCS